MHRLFSRALHQQRVGSRFCPLRGGLGLRQGNHEGAIRLVAFCTLAYVLCIALSVGPLRHLAPVRMTSGASTLLDHISTALPIDLGLASVPSISRQETGYLETMLLLALGFTAYGLCAVCLCRRREPTRQAAFLAWIGLGAGAGGAIYLFAPGLLSQDLYSYASYGHLLVAYHANPYFVPASAYPHDPLYPYIFWKTVVPLYGPVWIGVCALLSAIAGADHVAVVLAFRAFALVMHLLNMLLVAAVLQTRGQSPRTVALGTQLYGWNPLVLLESSLNGHVDVFMLTFLLLGLLLRARAERAGVARWGGMVAPLLPLTLAALVKYIALPAVALALFLAWRTVLTGPSLPAPAGRASRRPRWGPALRTLLCGTALCGGTVAAFYGPFLRAHSFNEAVGIYAAQPSTTGAFNSLLFTIRVWNKTRLLPASLTPLREHTLWTLGTLAAMLVALVGGALWVWRDPTTRTLALAALGTWGAFLVGSPWFFPWYLTALVGLVAVSLPVGADRLGRALAAFALTFSASSFLVYYSTVVGWLLLSATPPRTDWTLLMSGATLGAPLLAFLAFLVPAPRPEDRPVPVLNAR